MRLERELNPEQIKAVQTTNGPVLVLAGAGSGKTKALTHRIAYLLDEGVPPEDILAVTFTNKAAEEMRQRVGKLTTRASRKLIISTFHSLGARLLREFATSFDRQPNFSIFDEDDQIAAIKQVLKKLDLSPEKFKPTSISYQISDAKNELVAPAEYINLARNDWQKTIGKIYQQYEHLLKQNNAFDFDDLLTKLVIGLNEQEDLLHQLQDRWQYILVDEYQDTNTAQYLLVRLLSAKHRNLFVVGDDWQSIYSWRGANFRNILKFNEDYPDATIIKLEQNYRSTQNILDAAQSVIERNRDRSHKKLWTNNKEGELLVLYQAFSEQDEANFVLKGIEELHKTDTPYRQIAILYRTNAQSRVLEEKLIMANVPYRLYGGARFYSRKEIKDALAHLILLSNPFDLVAGKRALCSLSRGVGDKTWEQIANDLSINPGSLIDYLATESTKPAIQHFVKAYRKALIHLEIHPLSKVFDELLKEVGYLPSLNDGTVEGESRLANVLELKSVIEKYDQLKGPEALTAFLAETSLLTDFDRNDPNLDAINLMTVHSAKGLEFDYVFVVGLEEGLFPHSQAFNEPDGLEEERRLFYVALTRAKRNAYLVHSRERLLFGQRNTAIPSSFINDIPEHLLNRHQTERPAFDTTAIWRTPAGSTEFRAGDKVSHTKFGNGIVVRIKDDIADIAFAKNGLRQIQTDNPSLQKYS